MIGQTLSHYKILDKLGEGGMGVVYRARDTHLDRDVALKVLPTERVTNPERKRRFAQEAKAASALNHPNIITIYDIDAEGGVDFIAMEYAAGKTLDQSIGHKVLRLGECLKYAIQIADALSAAHAAGIVHRDLKPANIMVTQSGLVKVLDFGLAKLTEQEVMEGDATLTVRPATEEGTILGTAAYMSPEQAEGRKADARSDIFSFGSVLYEMLTGRQAFSGETKMSVLSAILRDEPKPLEGIPRDAEKIVQRCLRKEPERRFQHMDDLKVALEELKEESDTGRLPVPAAALPARRTRMRLSAIAALALAAIAGLAWWLTRPQAPAGGPVLTRLTSGAGLTMNPAVSPDGTLLAYASDRAGGDNLDIWVQQFPGGEPLRRTQHPADDYEPAFSPDGSKIAFRSKRDGGGIYVMPALTGDERLVARDGRRPRFSPDGHWIAYWVGTDNLNIAKLYVIAAGGGTPRQLQPDLISASHPVWSPDGTHILFGGRRADGPWDWWVTPLEGGPAVQTGMFDALGRSKFSGTSNDLVPGLWEGDRALFSAKIGDSTNLVTIEISARTWKVSGEPQRLTFGSGMEIQPASLAGSGKSLRRLVFSSLIQNIDVWGLPLQANQGKTAGPIQRLTQEAGTDTFPSLSADSKKLAFDSDRSGSWGVWLKDLESGRESPVTVSPAWGIEPVLSRDGARIAYLSRENRKTGVYVLATSGGAHQKLCDECGRPRDWMPDGSRILIHSFGKTTGIAALDAATGERAELAQHPRFNLYDPSASPDGRWIAFHARISPVSARVFVMPFRGDLVEEKDWIAVTDGKGWDRRPSWSPDGSLLYFTTERDGSLCIWAQRLEPVTKLPVGAPFEVYHSPSARLSLANVGNIGAIGLSVAANRMVFSMGEITGNIWMAEWR